MAKKYVSIMRLIVVIFIALSMGGCIPFDTGKEAVPVINPNPKHMIKITPVFERLPVGVNPNQYQYEMIARYETHKKACGITKKYSGVLIWTLYDAPVEGNIHDGFQVWGDKIVKDKCDWKLMHVEFYINKDNSRIFGMHSKIQDYILGNTKKYCVQSRREWERCASEYTKLKQSKPQDPNEWVINFNVEEIIK